MQWQENLYHLGMTVALEQETAWPEGVLFWPAWNVKYQTDYIARMLCMETAMLAADMGTGKSVMGLGVAGLAVENGLIDLILVVCEKNKLKEWLEDFGRFTRLPAAIYHGPSRKKLLGALPVAVITTYETCRDDVARIPPKGSKGKGSRTLTAGPMMADLAGKRVLVIYDESTKLKNRGSNIYKAHEWMLTQLRKNPGTRVVAMTGTPMETELEDIFNQMRLVVPHAMPTVDEFERRVVRSRHPVYRIPSYYPQGKTWFRDLVEPWILRKRKSDPDVMALFPPVTEEFRRIQMHADQFRIYKLLEDLAHDPATRAFREVPGLNILLRQLAGDPWAVLEAGRKGNSALAVMVADEMRQELESCSSAKAEELISIADPVLARGGKLMVFTFFGQSVLPSLVRRLEGRTVFIYHGGQTAAENDHQLQLFRQLDGPAILLLSDAGARGINVPEAAYVIEYELATRHALREQRKARAHRLGRIEPLTCVTLVLESSIEGASGINMLLSRNRDQDFILGDDTDGGEDFVTADNRRELFAQAKPRKAA